MYKSWFVCFIEQQSATLLIAFLINIWQILVEVPRNLTSGCAVGQSSMWSEFSDLVDLWVMKTKKSIWSFARVVHRDQVIRARHVDHTARTCDMFVYSIVKITRLHGQHTNVLEIHGCAKVFGLFFLDVLFGRWLAGQTNSDHMDCWVNIDW